MNTSCSVCPQLAFAFLGLFGSRCLENSASFRGLDFPRLINDQDNHPTDMSTSQPDLGKDSSQVGGGRVKFTVELTSTIRPLPA